MPEPPIQVFVSSVMTADHLAEERQAAIAAIESIRLTTPWAFEHSPATSQGAMTTALQAVEACDIFLILVGGRHSEPVQRELDEALRAKKPVLAFVSIATDGAQAPERQRVVDQIARHVKYQSFATAMDLGREVRIAIREELIRGYRRYRAKLSEQDLRTIIETEPPGLVVRTATVSDRPRIEELLLELKPWYPDIEGWIPKATQDLGSSSDIRVAETGGNISGLAVTRDKDPGDVRKFATLYVTADSRGMAIGPHLVREEVKRAANRGIRKAYVTFADELHSRIAPVLRQSGFVEEGISPARYRIGSAEWVMGKTFEYGAIGPDRFHAFVERCIISEHGGRLIRSDRHGFTATLPMAWGTLGTADRELVIGVSVSPTPEDEYLQFRDDARSAGGLFISMAGKNANTATANFDDPRWIDGADLAMRFYPVQFEGLDLESICVTIEPRYANALLPRSEQPRLMEPSRLQIRPDNVYYRHADRYRTLRRGANIFFYVSDPDQAIRGRAIVTGLTVGTPEDCFSQYGSRGILQYEDIVAAQNPSGHVLAIAFDWYQEFERPIRLTELRSLKSNFNPQTANLLSADESARIMERGDDG